MNFNTVSLGYRPRFGSAEPKMTAEEIQRRLKDMLKQQMLQNDQSGVIAPMLSGATREVRQMTIGDLQKAEETLLREYGQALANFRYTQSPVPFRPLLKLAAYYEMETDRFMEPQFIYNFIGAALVDPNSHHVIDDKAILKLLDQRISELMSPDQRPMLTALGEFRGKLVQAMVQAGIHCF